MIAAERQAQANVARKEKYGGGTRRFERALSRVERDGGNVAKGQDFHFQLAERCLYDYSANIARLETLRMELQKLDSLSSAKAQQYDGGGVAMTGGTVNDPVGLRVDRIVDLEEQIWHLERWTVPVKRFIADLEADYIIDGSATDEMGKLLRAHYLANSTWKETQDHLGVSAATLRRRRRMLVKKAMEYLCLDISIIA